MASLQRVKGQFCMSFLICRIFFLKDLLNILSPVVGTGSIDFILSLKSLKTLMQPQDKDFRFLSEIWN